MKVNKNKVKETDAKQINMEERHLNKTEVWKQNKSMFKQNAFNVNKVRSRLNETYARISHMFDILNLNRDSFVGGNSGNVNLMKNGSKDDIALSVPVSNHAVSTDRSKVVKIRTTSANGNITKISWPKTLEGLVEAMKLFKGKKLTYQERVLKRSLKYRVTKKRKKLEFQMKLEGKKKGLIVEELLKNKRIKPIYNNEGKIIHSKYDFSEIGTKKDFCQKFIKDSNKISLNNTAIENESKNDKNIISNVESDTESFSKISNSAKQKEIRKKKKKSKLIENSNMTLTSDNQQEPIKKKLKLIDKKMNSMCNENETENKAVITTKFKPIFNKDNKMVFSKIDFPDTNINKKLKKKEYRDPKKLLQTLEMNKAKIDELKNSDKEKATGLIEKEKWITALRRASGEKIKDDPQLLKKTLIREKNRKKKSKKKWDAKIDAVKKKQQEKQKKRMENIMAKKKEKKKKKQKKAMKKGHYFSI